MAWMDRGPLVALVPAAAAGKDWSFTPSTSDRVRLFALTAKLATNATADNRQVAIKVATKNGDLMFQDAAPSTQAASLTYEYTFSPEASRLVVAAAEADSIVGVGLPAFWLPAGATISSSTALLQGGDQWSEMVATYLVGDVWGHEAWAAELAEEVASRLG